MMLVKILHFALQQWQAWLACVLPFCGCGSRLHRSLPDAVSSAQGIRRCWCKEMFIVYIRPWICKTTCKIHQFVQLKHSFSRLCIMSILTFIRIEIWKMKIHLKYLLTQLRYMWNAQTCVYCTLQENSMPTDSDIAVSLVLSVLSNPTARPVIIFIDALNQVRISSYFLCFLSYITVDITQGTF